MKKIIEDTSENEDINCYDKEIMNYLSEINSTIADIRKSEKKQYSLLSSILNCFYENKKISLPRQAIYDYIYKDVINYKGKMIISFVINGTNTKELINEENYIKKAINIIYRNKCLVAEGEEYVSMNTNFIKKHKSLLYRNLFGKDAKLSNAHTKFKKLKKTKNNSLLSNNNTNKGSTDANSNNKENKEEMKNQDDYEIEIIDSEQYETDTTELKKENDKNIKSNVTQNTSNSEHKKNVIKNINKIIVDTSFNEKKPENQYLNKKRNNKKLNVCAKNEKDKINNKGKTSQNDGNNLINNINESNEHNIEEKKDININIKKNEEYQKRNKKDDNEAEKEILSLIEEGKLFLSLFKDKELLNEFETHNNTSNESDSFIKSILLSYQNEDMLQNYLNVLNDDYTEFKNCLKSLINFKEALDDDKSNKFMANFSIMNKIILGKEKCNLLIDKIVIKLKQLLMEYNYIKKVLNSFEANKVDVFQKFRDIMTIGSNIKEKDNYVNNVKMQLQDKLSKVLIVNKVQKGKEK